MSSSMLANLRSGIGSGEIQRIWREPNSSFWKKNLVLLALVGKPLANSTGALFYDNDGVGGNAQVQFAILSTGLALTNLDFLVVA
jgi:hypothetical protein